MNVKQSKDFSISLSQNGFIDKTLDKYLINKTAKCSTPSGNDLFNISKDSPELSDKRPYLSCIMSLMYLARLTRPDILMPVTFLASRSHIATEEDFKKLQRILEYLNGTKNKGMHIKCNSLEPSADCDASYGIHSDGKSHTGFIIMLGLAVILVKSAKQKVTALSSTDAEIIALCDCVKTLVWITNLLQEITDYKGTAIIKQDNKSAVWLTTEPTRYRRSKHLLTKISYIRDHIINKTVKLLVKKSAEMMSDGLTKPKQGHAFAEHCIRLVTEMQQNKKC